VGHTQDSSYLNGMKSRQTYTIVYQIGRYWNKRGGRIIISRENDKYFCEVKAGVYSENKKFIVSDHQMIDLKRLEKEIITESNDKKCEIKMRYKIKVGSKRFKLIKCSKNTQGLIKDWMKA
jgi:hypothetical protein